uniref:Junctional adhesion molecule A n=1 Tax=Nothobranchius rachovii TaxID=451742 RepID=A0A1A8PLA8_9TELE
MRWLVSVLLFFSFAGVSSFSVTTSNADVKVKENAGADLTCTVSADFGSNPRVEWKFDKLGSQTFVVFNGVVTDPYASRVTLYSRSNLRFSKVTREDTGVYTCEASSSTSGLQKATVKLTVLVPPSVPICGVPDSVTTGKSATLTCFDPAASPPPTYRWYKDGTLLPSDPSKFAGFQNATYKLDPATGKLDFPSAAKMDSGQYYCEVSNEAGPTQKCQAQRMEVRDLNTGGIVAGVIIFLLLLGLVIFGVWYANKKGYLPTAKTEGKHRMDAVYQPTSHGGDDDNGEFKQKSSFVV